MKIALFTDTLDEINGVSRFICDMADRAEGRLTVFTASREPKRKVTWRVNVPPVVSIAMPWYSELRLALPRVLRLAREVRRRDIDVIHVSTPGPMGLAGIAIAKALGLPVVATYHTNLAEYVQVLSGEEKFGQISQKYLEWFYRRVDRVLVRSRACALDAKAIVLPAGTDLLKFRASCAERAGQAPRLNGKARLLYVGRISREKNLCFLMRMIEQIRDVELMVAGDGPMLPELRTATVNLPITFLGYQNDERLLELYRSANLFVFPSRTDTLGQVVMEAQACGLPAIVSDEGGPRELVLHEQTGLILPADDPARWANAIRELLADPDRLNLMARQALIHSRRFDLDATAAAFFEAHQAVLKESGTSNAGNREAYYNTATSCFG